LLEDDGFEHDLRVLAAHRYAQKDSAHG
jgi:hypothetical protein